jgi:hypothetical protein
MTPSQNQNTCGGTAILISIYGARIRRLVDVVNFSVYDIAMVDDMLCHFPHSTESSINFSVSLRISYSNGHL